MGQLCSSDPTSTDIDRHMSQDNTADHLQKKLLFLGAGGAGKSTIFKQLKTIHSQPMNEAEKNEHVEAIRTDLVLNMKLLIRKSGELFNLDKETFGECLIDDQQPEVAEAIASVNHAMDYAQPESDIVEFIKFLWGQPSIQATWSHRQNYAVSECAHYFFENIERVCRLDYRPTEEDLLLARVRTTGIIKTTFLVSGHEFLVVDVGGQRNERKKWEHCFDDVTAVIFVASLSSFCEVLFEDERKNGMEESLSIFAKVSNSKTFTDKDIILFLNKEDLFHARIRDGKSVSICFGSEYNGPVFNPLDGTEDDFDNAVREMLVFIQGQYARRKEHKEAAVYIHITTATDRGNVQRVFWDVQNIVLRGALKKGHLL